MNLWLQVANNTYIVYEAESISALDTAKMLGSVIETPSGNYVPVNLDGEQGNWYLSLKDAIDALLGGL